MRIGIDARVLDKGITGTGRFLYNLLQEIPNVDHSNKYYVFSSRDIDIDKSFYDHIIFPKFSLIPFKIFSPFWLYKILPNLLIENNIDILFSPNILLPFKKKSHQKFITVIHDIFPFTHKEYYPLNYRIYLSIFLPKTLRVADKIITISKFSKNEIIKKFKVPDSKISIIYNCTSQIFESKNKNSAVLLKKFNDLNLPAKYLLFVGAVEKRKNIVGLINIMDKLRSSGSLLKLVSIGKPSYGYKELMNAFNVRNSYIMHMNFVDDEVLYMIYKNAFAFIFPSFFEGFGIPPLEAMRLAVPIISSNTSSMPEVVGSGGILNDPKDYDKFVLDIQRLEKDTEFYNLMKEKALKQSEKFVIRGEVKKLTDIFNNIHFQI